MAQDEIFPEAIFPETIFPEKRPRFCPEVEK
jgi:hypothetical protein